ncbi:MAG: EscU/YscU/HrcU family type III secretion system export apparatus switch protein [Bdellovibrionales bacterium]|nr:EscU/YscU/HrcU family type III secretion system export apparatus switch protein [Bdellovibrionales bacterium]
MTTTKKPRFSAAVGLQYEGEDSQAPSVCVKGEGRVADEIVRLAQRFGVPIVEKSELTELLGTISLDEAIPEDLYEAVAVILCELESFQNRPKR